MPNFTPEKDSESLSSPSCGGVSNQSPTSIDQALELINSLPKPVSVSCFLSSLKTPLKTFAVDNAFSAQPSAGAENPRIFIFSGNLVISVVPIGPSSEVIELSELISPALSIKGEVPFPVTNTLPSSAPYSQILEGFAGTACRICHTSESRVLRITSGEAYSSGIIEPDPFRRVTQTKLLGVSLNCNSQENAERCRILDSIFVKGKAVDSDFPAFSE